MKKVSIITPVYNGAPFLPSFITNLLDYTFQDFEVIFVNNLSTDNSLQILQDELSKTSLDFKIANEFKPGAGYARNLGLSLASGEYVTFIDCDDSISKTKLEEDVKIMDLHKVDYVVSRTQKLYTNGRVMFPPLEGFDEGLISPPKAGLIWLTHLSYLQGTGAILAKREVINFLGGFHSSKTGQDAFLYIRLGLYASGYYYNKVNFSYIRHSSSAISTRNKEINGALLSYFNLWKNLYCDELVNTNKQAVIILERKIQVILLQLHKKNTNLKELTADQRLEKLKLNPILFNKVSLLLNRILPDIKFNPFYRMWLKVR